MTLALIAKVSCILGASLLATSVARRRPASWRALVLGSALAMSLLLPMAAPFVPTTQVRLPFFSGAASTSATPGAAVMKVLDATATDTPQSVVQDGPFQNPVWRVLRFVWFGGVVLSLLPVLTAYRRARALVACAVPDQSYGDSALATSRVQFRTSDLVEVPMVVGLFRPVVLMPRRAIAWRDEDRSRAVQHELEHVRRRDAWTTLIGRCAVAVHWFNPLAWMVWRRCLLQIECACDDAVVANGSATAYAEQLIALARHVKERQRTFALGMATPTDLAVRVRALLDPSPARGQLRPRSAWSIVVLTALLATMLTPLQLSAVQTRAESDVLPQRPAPVRGGGTVYGVVEDPTGAPLEGLVLILESECFGPGVGRACEYNTWTRTGRSGEFRFAGLPPRAFHITAQIDFFPGVKFQIGMGESLERDIRMAVEPVISEFTICADCAAVVVSDSLAKEFEADRQAALDHPVTAPRPPLGWEYYHPGNGEYPPDLREKGVEGTVTIEGVIGPDGVPTDIRAQSASAELARAAKAALAGEFWEPGRVRGVGVPVPFRFLIRYSLKNK